MTHTEVLKQALEALETVKHKIDSYQVNVCDDVDDAITSLRQAINTASQLAEAEQCKYPNCDYPCMNLPDCNDGIKWSDYESDGRIIKEKLSQPKRRPSDFKEKNT